MLTSSDPGRVNTTPITLTAAQSIFVAGAGSLRPGGKAPPAWRIMVDFTTSSTGALAPLDIGTITVALPTGSVIPTGRSRSPT